MATLEAATSSSRERVTGDILQDLLAPHGVQIKSSEVEEWRSLIASVQDSVDIVESLPDYVPKVNLTKFPRKDIHRLPPEANSGNAWAWKVTIDGVPDGPLRGLTFCLKDNIAVKDVPMLVGTDVFTDYVPDTDATVVTRILEAGGTIRGKAVCENLSLCASSFSAATGPVENPFAKGYTTGGSSSGCGHLVGAGVVHCGIGGDQGGSIRFPSAYCGLVGMKPTWGLVPWTGMMTHDPVHDTTGPMTLDVRTNAQVLQVIAGRDDIDDRQFAAPLPAELPNYSSFLTAGVKGLRVGILKEAFQFDGILDPRVKDKVLNSARLLESLGAELVEVSVPLHKNAGHIVNCALRPAAAQHAYLGKACGRRGLYLTGLSDKMAPLDQAKFDKMFSTSKFSLIGGLYCWSQNPSLYGKAMNLYRQLKDSYNQVLDTVDVLVMPTTPYVANRHATSGAGPEEQMRLSRGVAVNTVCFNASGHPAMSIPIGFLPPQDEVDDKLKLPVGMQIVGRMFDEATMYRVAAAWEDNFNWKEL